MFFFSFVSFFFTVLYANSPIIAHHITGSSYGITGYANFYCSWFSSLYNYDDEGRTSLIRSDSTAQTLRELLTNSPFSDKDRLVLLKSHFIFGDAIDTLSLPSCPKSFRRSLLLSSGYWKALPFELPSPPYRRKEIGMVTHPYPELSYSGQIYQV